MDNPVRQNKGRVALIATVVFLAAFIGIHFLMLAKDFTFDRQGGIRTAIAGYGDIPLHLTQVSKFAFGKLDFNEPIFEGTRLRYSFFINLFSGLLLKITHSWVFSFDFPAMLFAGANTILVYLLYKRLLRKRWAAIVALLIFFLGSGFGAYKYLAYETTHGGPNLARFTNYLVDNNISTINKSNAVYPEQNISWGAPLTLTFLHQRSFLMGFFLFLLVLYLLLRFYDTGNKKLPWAIGILAGLSPLAHYHSFVAIFVMLGIFAIKQLSDNNRDFLKRTAFMVILGLIVAAPQIVYLISGKGSVITGNNSFIIPRLGWMSDPTIGSVVYPTGSSGLAQKLLPFLKFIWINFGVILPMLLAVLTLALLSGNFRQKHPWVLHWAYTATIFFALVQLIRFQPWDYDNNKLLVFFQFFAAPALVAFFLWFMDRKKALGISALTLFFIIGTHSGFTDLLPRVLVSEQMSPVIFDKGALELADYIRKNVALDDMILTGDSHLNPVSSLAGRPVLVGYPGWLWTRGLDYSGRELDIKTFYSNPENNRSILDKYNIRYVLLDPQAIHDWGADKQVFDKTFALKFSASNYDLYKIRP